MPLQNTTTVTPTPTRQNAWKMFDRIAPRYDFLNRSLSFGQDILWRSSVAKWVPKEQNQNLLDLATGTADQLLSISKRVGTLRTAIGIDMSGEMLAIGRKKLDQSEVGKKITLLRGDALKIPLLNNSMNTITIAFGIRNLIDVSSGLKEMYRILKPQGTLIILEFSIPSNFFFRPIYLFYFRNILPVIGSFVSGDKKAYHYLNNTVETFPYGRGFCELMSKAGFGDIKTKQLNLGIATIYKGTKSGK